MESRKIIATITDAGIGLVRFSVTGPLGDLNGWANSTEGALMLVNGALEKQIHACYPPGGDNRGGGQTPRMP